MRFLEKSYSLANDLVKNLSNTFLVSIFRAADNSKRIMSKTNIFVGF